MKKMRILLASLFVAIAIVTNNLTGANAEWKNNSTGWWYSQESSYVTGWNQMDSIWYYFDSDGYMEKGWIVYKGDWYYLDSNGKMQTGIIQVDGKTYCLALTGAMQTGNVVIGEEKYSFENSGEAIGDKVPQATKAFWRDGITVEPIKIKDVSKSSEKAVEINIKGNPTTGYSWRYNIDKEGIIKEDSNQYKQDNAESGMTGVGGMYTWKFSALKEGIAEVTFEYSRPWEKEVIKTKTYIFNVDKELKIAVEEK